MAPLCGDYLSVFTVLRFSSVNQIYLVSTVWNTQIEKTKFFHVLIESFKVYSLFSYQGSYSPCFAETLEVASQLHCCQPVLDDSLLTISSLNFFVNIFFLKLLMKMFQNGNPHPANLPSVPLFLRSACLYYHHYFGMSTLIFWPFFYIYFSINRYRGANHIAPLYLLFSYNFSLKNI